MNSLNVESMVSPINKIETGKNFQKKFEIKLKKLLKSIRSLKNNISFNNL